MTDLAGALQRWLFTRLSAVAGLPPVVSEVPLDDEDQPIYPFVLLGDDKVSPGSDSKLGLLERHEFSVHVCMQSTTKLILRGFQQQVFDTLSRARPIGGGAAFGRIRFVDASAQLLEDGATYVSNSLFAVLAQPDL